MGHHTNLTINLNRMAKVLECDIRYEELTVVLQSLRLLILALGLRYPKLLF